MDTRKFKYCVRFTEAEHKRIDDDRKAGGYRSMSRYMRDRLFLRHSDYVPRTGGGSSLQKLVTRVSEATMSLADEGRKINAMAAAVNRRSELTRDGAPVLFGGMTAHWTQYYLRYAGILNRKLSNTKKMIEDYEARSQRK
jgi:hypothetical protein